MTKMSVRRFLKREAFFDAVAHAVYAHSLLTFLCEVEYSKIKHDFVLVVRDTLSEEFDALREILLQDFPKDDESILECQSYIREHFGVGLEIFNLTQSKPVQLQIVSGNIPMIEPLFLKKEEMMIVAGHASVAFHKLMEMDSFDVSDSKEVETLSLEATSSILAILLQELLLHAPLIPACEEYVMEKHELAIPFPVHAS